MIRCQKWINGQMIQNVINRVIDTPEHRADGRELLKACKAECTRHMGESEIGEWWNGEFATRDNPSFGQLGLIATDREGHEVCTFWWQGNDPDDKAALRRASAASAAVVGLPGDPPQQHYPERNGRWGGVHKFEEPTYLRDLVKPGDCGATLLKAQKLLRWYRGLLEAAMAAGLPGLSEDDLKQADWAEVLPHE